MDVTAKIYEEEVAQIGQATDYCCQEDGVLVAFPNEKCRNKGCEAGPEEVESVLPDYGTCRCGVVGLKDVGIYRVGYAGDGSGDISRENKIHGQDTRQYVNKAPDNPKYGGNFKENGCFHKISNSFDAIVGKGAAACAPLH